MTLLPGGFFIPIIIVLIFPEHLMNRVSGNLGFVIWDLGFGIFHLLFGICHLEFLFSLRPLRILCVLCGYSYLTAKSAM